MRLRTNQGGNYIARYPLVAEALARLRVSSIVLDGEAVAIGADGMPDFDALWNRTSDESVMLFGESVRSAQTLPEIGRFLFRGGRHPKIKKQNLRVPTPLLCQTKELEPDDFHIAVRRREHTDTPWRWEIWAAGKSKAVEHSEQHFATMSEAMRQGKAALSVLLRTKFPDAA